jgi:trehalose synthase
LYGTVRFLPRSLHDYREFIGPDQVARLQQVAAPLKGIRILHLNVFPFGTRVAETLGTLTPLMNSLGMQVDWQVFRSSPEFDHVNQSMYRCLGGASLEWTPDQTARWLKYNSMNAELFEAKYDFVVVHDPQPTALRTAVMERGRLGDSRWVWHCHLDIGPAQRDVWQAIRPHVEGYDAVLFALPEYLPQGWSSTRVWYILPAIDPIHPRNAPLARETAEAILRRYGLDPDRPLVCQIAPLDPWADPLGTVEAFRGAKAQAPQAQLVIVAAMAASEPRGRAYYDSLAEVIAGDPAIHLLSSLNYIGNIESNALERTASVLVQKSARFKGFPPGIAEAMWKGRPVITGAAGGAPWQVEDGETGLFAEHTGEFSERMAWLLGHPEAAEEMGQRGQQHIRDGFLITRYLEDYLETFLALAAARTPAGPSLRHP